MSNEVKTYKGIRVEKERGRGRVLVTVNNEPLLDYSSKLMSEGIGFEWGFSHGRLGKKGLNLSKSILIEHFGSADVPNELVQEFADRVIYNLSQQNDWAFTSDVIDKWAKRVFVQGLTDEDVDDEEDELDEPDEEDKEDEIDEEDDMPVNEGIQMSDTNITPSFDFPEDGDINWKNEFHLFKDRE